MSAVPESAANDDAALDPRWSQAMEAFDRGDRGAALTLYKALAADGDKVALVEVGNLYELGALGSSDFEEAARWYQRAVFEFGDPKADLALARLHFNGQLATEARSDAFRRHAIRAAEHDEPLSWLMLGLAHETGNLCPKDVEKASAFYTRAAKAGMALAGKRLAVIALKDGRPFRALRMFLFALFTTVRQATSNPRDPRLAGLRRGERR